MAFSEGLDTRVGYCPSHFVPYRVFTDKEIEQTFGPRLIFYCPEPGCDCFDWGKREGLFTIFDIADFFLKTDFLERYKIVRGSKPSREEVPMITQLFRNAVRLKILFFKQHPFNE